MAAIAAPEAERAHHIVKIPAARDGTLAFFRARSQLHGGMRTTRPTAAAD